MAISQHCFDYNFWDHTNWLGKWNGGYDLYEKKRKCTIVTNKEQAAQLDF